MAMFCRQCEQTFRQQSCVEKGVCGKPADVAALQDLLIQALTSIAVIGERARSLGIIDSEVDRFIIEGLFTTVTNVNFDVRDIEKIIYRAGKIKEQFSRKWQEKYKSEKGHFCYDPLPEILNWTPAANLSGLLEQARSAGLLADERIPEDIRSLREILLYGLKGMAAYADHALILGAEDEEVMAFFHKGLSALANDQLNADKMVNLIMEFGGVNLKCMEILDKAHTTHFGDPVPTKVFWGVKPGPGIIVSGHDLLDLENLLEQTQGKGINIYTHGEMLAAHGYPKLKKHPHLAGHFGTAWQNQQKEFENIPAVILMTTNCIQEPRPSYFDRVMTTGLVAWPGVTHISVQNGKKDFTPLINKAIDLKGFTKEVKEREITVGFGHHTVLGIADKVLELIHQKKIRHFFLIGGCDGAKPGRNYYSDFARQVPQDCVILTLACGKFRINQDDYGTIEGLPRLLDCGQCNDAYSAIKIASALAGAFKCNVNELPLSLVLSWYEQKAVCILLTLLSLGIKNIRLGPSLPAFISPNVLKLLVEKFNIQPVKSVAEDVELALQNK
jgi:hydroxylamine reductase